MHAIPPRWPTVLAAIAMMPGIALAGPDPLQVVYSSQGACPDQRAFLDELYSRTHRVRPAVGDEQAWVVRAKVQASETVSSGVVQIDSWNGLTTTREMTGANCTEVVAALALVAALSIDPGADAPAACPPARQPVSALKTAPARAAPIRVSGLAQEEAADHGPALSARANRTWVTGAQFLSMGGVGPSLLPGASLHFGYEPDSSVLAARIRASLGYLPPGSYAWERGQARFGWSGARLDGCPVRVGTGPAALLACATLGAGWIRADNASSGTPQATRLWADVGAAARFELAVNSWLMLDGQAGLVAPLARYTFEFDNPTFQVFRTPAAAGLLALGLASRFP